MCMNCGCKMWDDDMGNEDNQTLTKLAKAAIASEEDGKTTLENMTEAVNTITAEQLDQKIQELQGQTAAA